MKPSALLIFTGLTIALAALVVWLIVTDRDPTLFLTALPIIVAQVGLLLRTEKVVKQTNGTLSALREHAATKDAENQFLRSLLTPEQASQAPVTYAVSTPASDE